MTEGQPRSGAHHACLEQRIGHARNGFHRQDRIANRSRRHRFFAQRTQGAQLPELLKRVGFESGNQPGPFPSLQLAGTDGKDAQNVLTTDSWSLRFAPTGGADESQALRSRSHCIAELELAASIPPQLMEQLHRNRSGAFLQFREISSRLENLSHCDYAKSERG